MVPMLTPLSVMEKYCHILSEAKRAIAEMKELREAEAEE